MSELQTDSVESEVNEPAVIENPDNGAELATASESEHGINTETVEEVESEASKQQKYINTQYGQIKQGERDLAKANEKISQFEQSVREQQAAQVGNIPPMPTDQFDDNYETDLKAHIDGVRAQERYNTENNAYLQQQQNTQLQQQQAAQQEAAKLQSDFVTNAKGAGATDEEFNSVINTLNNGGMTVDTAAGIMSQGADGYFVAKHLAANPQEANEFNSLSQMQQGMMLVELKQKASVLKPKTSSTPAPATNLQGNGVDPEAGRFPNSKGATFK